MSNSKNEEDIFTTWNSDIDNQNLTVVYLCGELDASSVPGFLTDVKDLIKREHDIILDAHLLAYMDSTGLAAILSLKNVIEESGYKLYMAGCHGIVTKIMHITQIDGEIRCFESLDNAISELSPSGR